MHTPFDTTKLSPALAAMLLVASACTQDANDGVAADNDRAGNANEPGLAAAGQDRPSLDPDRVSIGQDAPARSPDDRSFGRDDQAEAAGDAQELVDEAVTVVNRMQADPEVAELLSQAHGIFIIPDYAQAGFIVGGEGGEGIALLKSMSAGGNAAADAGVVGEAPAGQWSEPAFYDFGGVTAGAEAGVEVGSIAMLLMSEESAELFRTEQTNFSIDASAGLTIVDYSARADAAAGTGDIIIWSDTVGAFAGATIGINGVSRDEEETAALLSDRAQQLRDALAG